MSNLNWIDFTIENEDEVVSSEYSWVGAAPNATFRTILSRILSGILSIILLYTPETCRDDGLGGQESQEKIWGHNDWFKELGGAFQIRDSQL